MRGQGSAEAQEEKEERSRRWRGSGDGKVQQIYTHRMFGVVESVDERLLVKPPHCTGTYICTGEGMAHPSTSHPSTPLLTPVCPRTMRSC